MEELKLKKHKKESSKKFHKKSKKHKKKHASSESSCSENDTSEWVEAPNPVKSDGQQHVREDWMCQEEFVPTFSKDDVSTSKSRQKKTYIQADINKEIQNERELNPYWKDNGKGLPDKAVDTDSLRLPSTSVGDGGYGWLKKAYRRIQEQANREGRSMEEIAVERWGSLDKLVSMINEAESRMKSQSLSSVRIKHRIEEPDNKRTRKMKRPDDDYSDSFNSTSYASSSRFKKPQMDDFDISSESIRPVRSDYKNKEHERYESDKKSYPSWKKPHNTDDFDEPKHTPSWRKADNRDNFDEHKNKPSWKKPEKTNRDDFDEDKRTPSWRKSDNKDNFDDNKQIPSWKKPKNRDDFNDSKSADNQKDEVKPSKIYTAVNKLPTFESEQHTKQTSGSPHSSEPEIMPMTEEEITKLSAKYHKAELMGNVELAAKLKAQLDGAKTASVSSGSHTKQKQKFQEHVVLSKMDSSGQSRPIYFQNREDKNTAKPKQGHSRKSEFFDEDSKYSLKQMFEREKLTTVDDHLEMFLEVASESKDPTDQDYDLDDVSKTFSKKMSHSRQETKDIGKAIYQHQRLSSALERCQYCLDQPNMKKHLIISIGFQAYLCLPPFQSVTEGHCLIVPKSHVSSCLYLDEDEWLDIKNFKENLRKMFLLEEKSAIFIETSLNFRSCPHAIVECIPMPKETADLAPLYFKKAIQESEAEWSHNKKLVDLTNKGLRYSIPKELPYFFVEFDPDIHRGYAHVIEEEKEFPRNFGKEVVGGMLDIDYNHLYKNRKEDPIKKSKEVLDFEKRWKDCNPDF